MAEGAQTVVMIHGLATSCAFWYGVAQELAREHRVILFDLRGHGKSSMPPEGYTPQAIAADVAGLLDILTLENACIVGHSFGGSVALHFACGFPARVRQLVLADVRLRLFQPQLRPDAWANWPILRPALEEMGIVLAEDEADAGYRLLTELARVQTEHPKGTVTIPPHLAPILPQGGSRRTALQWLKLLDTTPAWEDFTAPEQITLEHLQQLTLPILLVYGAQSPTAPTGRALHQLWPHSTLEWVDPGGHFFPLSRPKLFANQVQQFLHGVVVP